MGDDEIDIQQQTAQPLALTTSAAYTPALQGGRYDVWCDVDAFINVSPNSLVFIAATGYPILAGNIVANVRVDPGSRIGGILAAGTGTLKYHRTGG